MTRTNQVRRAESRTGEWFAFLAIYVICGSTYLAIRHAVETIPPLLTAIFGSVVAFSAYTWLLERRSATLVATHTFVNPVIAVLLGWLMTGERLSLPIAGATALILIAVFLLRSSSERPRDVMVAVREAA